MRSAPGLLMLALAFVPIHSLRSEESDQQLLIQRLREAKISLQEGIVSAQRNGRPITVQFEMKSGKLQLTVETEKDGKFFRTNVDHTNALIDKAGQITDRPDLIQAKSHSAAMAHASTELKVAADKAVASAAGSRAIAVVPELTDGHSVARILLLSGGRLLDVTERLD